MKNNEKANRRLERCRLGHSRLEHCGFTCKLLLGVAICVVTLGSALTASADDRPIALTESGVVIGSRVDGINEFLGIPFAAPPVGTRRWMPPSSYGLFPGFILQATQFGSKCTQASGGSENCLFLNVYTPRLNIGDGGGHGLPVMVWIHGGGLINGSSDPFDPTRLVKKGVIVVTINYRLGYLGFFAQSAIDAEGHLNGNYGLMDQQFALKWVRRNIAGFGGDPHRVTIFGESAGGQSVYAQLASPLAAGLFGGAIAESGSYLEFQDYFSRIITLAEGETTGSESVPSGAAIADSVGCTSQTASCLRVLPASTMVAGEPCPVFPFVDGTLLTQTPSAAFASGEFNQVPVISGTNHDEYRLFVAEDYDFVGNPILTSAEYDTAVAKLCGDRPWGRPSSPCTHLPVTRLAVRHWVPQVPTESSAVRLVMRISYCRNLLRPMPMSSMMRTRPRLNLHLAGSLTFPLGAYHTSEVQYLFKGYDVFGLPVALSPKQMRLSNAMISYWTQFAKTGDPNSSGEPVWSPYSASTDQFQSLIPPTPVVESNFAAEHQCSTFWDTF